MTIKPLKEQTLMNNYVFAMVMREPKRIKPLLEHILEKKITKISMVEPEKTMKEKFESKGIRLDLYVEDEDGIVYDVEVQTTDQKNLPQRMRYYQAMLDITFFPTGANYNLMRRSYVIFICNFDPYGEKRYIYTFQNRCDQNHDLLMGDEAVKVVVNTKGTVGEISEELKEALKYLDSGEVTGEYSRELDDAVNKLKDNEERGHEYMLLMTYGAERETAGKYIGKVEMIRNWCDGNKGNKKMSESEMAEALMMKLPIFQGVVSLIKDHPDWDDATVADKAAWR